MPNNTALPARTGQDFLAELEACPQLAAHKLMTTVRRAASGDDLRVHPELDAALDLAAATSGGLPRTVGQPQRLAGSILVTQNRSVRPARPTIDARPTPPTRAALIAAETLTHDLLQLGMPDDLAGRAATIAQVIEPIARAFAGRGMDRRGPMFADAAAQFIINFRQPTDLTFIGLGQLRAWHADHLEQHPFHACAHAEDVSTDDVDGAGDVFAALDRAPSGKPAGALKSRPRVAWSHHYGPEHGLLVDRVHHTPYDGVLERDTWTLGKVVADLRAIADLLGPAHQAGNLGVRVMMHRAPNAGVHFLPAYLSATGGASPGGSGPVVIGEHHRIGGCRHCQVRTVLPGGPSSSSTACVAPRIATGARA